ncbi:MAG: 2-polyprenyl-3-methyl-6-methoxy-1,4-benzoquinone monooxygenase [Mariprofundaceae bacterium]
MNPPPFRRYSLADQLISHIDRALYDVFCEQRSSRPNPAKSIEESDDIDPEQAKKAANLMRVNHAGEVCAQALYHGQSLTARDPSLRDKLRQASSEESDHLAWCRQRLTELGSRPSHLDPLLYAGSMAIGVTAGILGDRWNLGFLAETEHQVVRHLDSHLVRLPPQDEKSRAIISQMREDELGHAELAEDLGAAKLPAPVKSFMRLTAKVMTTLTERF